MIIIGAYQQNVILSYSAKSGTIGTLTSLRKKIRYLRIATPKLAIRSEDFICDINVCFMPQLLLSISNEGTFPLHNFFSDTLYCIGYASTIIIPSFLIKL